MRKGKVKERKKKREREKRRALIKFSIN